MTSYPTDRDIRDTQIALQMAQVTVVEVVRYRKLFRSLVKREPGIADRHADLLIRFENIAEIAEQSREELMEQMGEPIE